MSLADLTAWRAREATIHQLATKRIARRQTTRLTLPPSWQCQARLDDGRQCSQPGYRGACHRHRPDAPDPKTVYPLPAHRQSCWWGCCPNYTLTQPDERTLRLFVPSAMKGRPGSARGGDGRYTRNPPTTNGTRYGR